MWFSSYTIRLHLVDQLTVVYFSGASYSARGGSGTKGRPVKRSARGTGRPCGPDGASLPPTARYYVVGLFVFNLRKAIYIQA